MTAAVSRESRLNACTTAVVSSGMESGVVGLEGGAGDWQAPRLKKIAQIRERIALTGLEGEALQEPLKRA
ncbi:hypothetical protein [Rhodothermus bifroesti]|uniref:hypothetical protein n=1 Tax=Rhodothermus bifroesti TaxID=2823335 RepID=UPI001AEFC01D|nr:hypothetical protein [Rhodothermus bifroesti]